MWNDLKRFVLDAYFALRSPLIAAASAAMKRNRSEPENINKILVIRPDRLGDLVLTLPVFDNLRLNFPKARIDVLVRKSLAPLARMAKTVDEVLTYDGLLRAARRVRSERYDLVFDMLYDHKLRSALLAAYTGAPKRVGFAWGGREALFTNSVPRCDGSLSMVELNLKLVEAAGVPPFVRVPRLYMEKAADDGKMKIAVHPGGYYPSQRWPAEKFALLARSLAERYDAKVTVVGGPDERRLVDRVVSLSGDKRVEGSMPDTAGLAAIINGCAILVCNNSGPMHLACALDVPTVSTMGPTDPVLWWPIGKKNIVVRKDASMRSISVDDMIAAVERAMSA